MMFQHECFFVLLCVYFVSFSLSPLLSQSSVIIERIEIPPNTAYTRLDSNKQTFVHPSDKCTFSPLGKSAGNNTILKLIHAHGPCSPVNKDVRTPMEMLMKEQEILDATKLPSYYNSDTGSGEFVVPVGVGTPPKQYYLSVDIRFDLTWIQCLPCQQCFKQTEPIFNPSKSTSFSAIPCGSPLCIKDDGITCSGSKCTYSVPYASNAFKSSGGLSQDILTLNNLKQSFAFGCNDYSIGSFGPNAGFLSLGTGPSSILSQKKSLFNNYFSYCFPRSSSKTGYLSLGNDGNSARFIFVPFSQSFSPTAYSFDLSSFSIGDITFNISPNLSMLMTTGLLSRLPKEVYTIIKQTFMKTMDKVPRAPATQVLDTCYDLSNVDITSLPTISFGMDGLTVTLSINNFFIFSIKQACFAYLPTNNDYGTFGTTQQQTIEFAFDLTGKRLGFGDNC